MSLLLLYNAIAHSKIQIDTSVLVDNYTSAGFGTVYAGIQIDSDGDVYYTNSSGTLGASAGTWLVKGLNSQVWVEMSITSGTLTTDGIGASRVAMTSDRYLDVRRSALGIKACTFTLLFYNASSGGTLLASKSVHLEAERT